MNLINVTFNKGKEVKLKRFMKIRRIFLHNEMLVAKKSYAKVVKNIVWSHKKKDLFQLDCTEDKINTLTLFPLSFLTC